MNALPNLHAAILHFPIVLLPAAVVAETVGLIRWRSQFLDRLAGLLWGIAAVAAVATFYAGRSAADGLIDVPPVAQLAVAAHSDSAWWLVAVAVGIAVVRAGAFAVSGNSKLAMRAGGLLVGVGLLLQLVLTADRGGALVYQYRLAVAPVEIPECPVCEAPPEENAPPSSRWKRQSDGSATWSPLAGDLSHSDSIATTVGLLSETSTAGVLSLQSDGRSLLLLPGSWANVQVNARLDLRGFDGTIGLVHHVDADASTYGTFLLNTDGDARLTAVTPAVSVLHEARWEPVEALVLSVSVAGSHLKGLVAGKMVNHGHTPAGPDGRVGLLIDGTGPVLIEQVEIIPMNGH